MGRMRWWRGCCGDGGGVVGLVVMMVGSAFEGRVGVAVVRRLRGWGSGGKDGDDVVKVMLMGWCGAWRSEDGVVTSGVVEVILGGGDWPESGRNLGGMRERHRKILEREKDQKCNLL
ncbi:hypothetical protein Tco_1556710 [Tanacetum coccineum]